MTIYGRRHAVELVRDIMIHPPGQPGRHPPVLLFEGARGSGKTALLTGLSRLLQGRVPHAHIDLAARGPSGMPQLLSALAFHLGRRYPLYGALSFPRLAVGQLVMNDTTLDLSDRDRARSQIRKLLLAHRRVDQVVAALRDTAGNLPAVLPDVVLNSANLATRLLGPLVDQLASWLWSRRFVLGRAQHWYGRRAGGRGGDSVDVLIELNRWHRDPDAGDNARQRDELLWAAFREDLRSALGRRLRKPWLPRCVVLLDNADTRLGRHVLTEIVRLRSDAMSVAGGGDGARPVPDPLAVVATSREPFDHLPPGDQLVLTGDSPLVLTADDPLALPDGGRRWPLWVRYRLADLTETDVAHKVHADLPTVDRRLPMLIQQFARGNPLATTLLLDAARDVAVWPAGGDELGVVLARLEPAPPADTNRRQFSIGERLSRHLLGLADDDPFPSGAVESLTTCAAARDENQALILAARSGLLPPTAFAGAAGTMLASLWPSSDGTAAAPLRRLLLRRLAARPGNSADSWSAAHGWLRAHCAAREDRIGELYHALATGDVGYVSTHVVAWSDEKPADEWLAAVRSICQAPANLPHDEPPAEQAHRLAGRLGTEPAERLSDRFGARATLLLDAAARLVTQLWLAGDPFSGRERVHLHRGIARDYRALAPHVSDGQQLLMNEAARHDRLAEQWQQ